MSDHHDSREDDFEQYARQMSAHLESLERRFGTYRVELTFPHLITLIAQLQLALRHPGNTGNAAVNTRAFVDGVIETLEKAEPAIGPLLRAGDNAARDIPRKKR